MTSLTRCLVPAALCVSVYLLAGCNRETLPTVPIPPEQDPARIEITPSSLTLTSIGLTQKLSAEVFDVDDAVISYAVVSWSSSETRPWPRCLRRETWFQGDWVSHRSRRDIETFPHRWTSR